MKTYFNIMVPKHHEWLPEPLYLKYLSKVANAIRNRNVKIFDVKENGLYDKNNTLQYSVYMFECFGDENNIADLYPYIGPQELDDEKFKRVRYA